MIHYLACATTPVWQALFVQRISTLLFLELGAVGLAPQVARFLAASSGRMVSGRWKYGKLGVGGVCGSWVPR